ncbi:MAG: rhomboid family intramembrane serine protease [Rubrivivax sp.]|nr:rhomboid family intramembrane serine protease [Pyrinomonadaceae bacterium]
MAEGQSKEAGGYAGRPSVCHHCGALVGAGEGRCMMCGTTVVAPAREAKPRRDSRPDQETLRFLRAVISRPATFTVVFLIANVFLYLLMWLSGGATGSILLAYGAKLNHLINQEGQWWRFVTPIFLHVHLPGLGPMHLIANMYGLFMLGPYVERLYGSAKFTVFWVLTGIAGVAASYLTVRPELAHGALGRFLFKPFDTPSAGASGALFGLIGVLFVFGLKYRGELPEGLKRAFGTGMLPTILINLFIGYVGRGFIDNAAHLGGLVSGMALALVVGYKRPGPRGPVAVAWHALQFACLALVALSFVMVMRHFDAPPPRLNNLSERIKTVGRSPVAPFVESINMGRNALVRFLNDDPTALAPALEKLEKTPALSDQADDLRDELKSLLARARDIAQDKALKPNEREQRAEQLSEDLKTWDGRFDGWVLAEGTDFGIKMQKDEPPSDQQK